MTLDELRSYIKSVCEAHRDIKDFYTGNDYNQAEQVTHKYPMVFYELPYFLNYNLTPHRQIDNVQFAFNVFVQSNWDKIEQDHDAISKAKEIGDAIVSYIIANATDFIVVNVTAVSVREFTRDSVAGMRFEWTVQLPRTYCDTTDWTEIFNPID